MIKIMTIFGTRPEAIKMCPLILKIKEHKEMKCCVCLTGQHKEMLDQVMKLFQIKEDYNIHIMKKNQTLQRITCDVLEKLDPVLDKEKPDLILVHGDTTTSFAGGLAAFYKGIPVGHVEAGLRTYNVYSPYPEEFNRQSVDIFSELYFVPTEMAKQNLLREGKCSKKIIVTGNTVIDALKSTVVEDYYNEDIEWGLQGRMILLTAHRRESIGQPMRNMFIALKRIVIEYPDVRIIYPIHKNPKVRRIADEVLSEVERIKIIEPLDVFDFHNFMSRSYLILTDSGGIQEEAPALGKPVLVLRDTTERPEGVEAGTLRLVGTDEERIYRETKLLLDSPSEYKKMCKAVNPYGDGHASERIVEALNEYFMEK